MLPLGYTPAPPGHVVCVVTCLEMLAPPGGLPGATLPDGITLEPLVRPDIAVYRALYRKIGENWLWFSRFVMSDDNLRALLLDDRVNVFSLRRNGDDVGMLELDFREPDTCELAFFGVSADHIGKGLGRALMGWALERAWSHPIRRLWVHTCTFDHPSALQFYIRSGFEPYEVQIEMQPDPRLTGHLPTDAAPHVPIVRGSRRDLRSQDQRPTR
jgi:GNAT superfamily N-acetyltransferase